MDQLSTRSHQMRHRCNLVAMFALVAVGLCGCEMLCGVVSQTGDAHSAKRRQAKGPVFVAAMHPPLDKALIYFYRLPPKGKSTALNQYYITVNGKAEKVVAECGYYPLETDPGHLTFISNIRVNKYLFPGIPFPKSPLYEIKGEDARLEVDAEAGAIYYVKFDTEKETEASIWTPRLLLISNSVAEIEIRSCRSVSEQ